MLSPAMLKNSLSRRTSLREKSAVTRSRRNTPTPVMFAEDDFDPSCFQLGIPVERKGAGSRRSSADPSTELPKLCESSRFEIDLLITEGDEIIVLPHRELSPHLTRGMDELQVSGSKIRRQSYASEKAISRSPRGSFSSSDSRKHRRDSNAITGRKDSNSDSAPVYAQKKCLCECSESTSIYMFLRIMLLLNCKYYFETGLVWSLSSTSIG
ncbi:unnamed protein product [Anisakis simplex]|uniref:CARMIL_C domain-containing protein n=1 Tax=Anisakis simplex TaxID=6269 RepID=A0A0M3JR26_ANISI|nr:unnamed protein product [Anisakis simplex]